MHLVWREVGHVSVPRLDRLDVLGDLPHLVGVRVGVRVRISLGDLPDLRRVRVRVRVRVQVRVRVRIRTSLGVCRTSLEHAKRP